MHKLDNREPQREARAQAKGTFDGDFSSHHLRQSAADGEAKAGSAMRACVSALDLDKSIEHAIEVAGRDANPGVFDDDSRPIVLAEMIRRIGALARVAAHAHSTAGRRELHRVRQKVRENLLNALRIPDVFEEPPGVDAYVELDAFCSRLRANQRQSRFDGVVRDAVRRLHADASGLDLCEVEDLVDNGREVLTTRANA